MKRPNPILIALAAFGASTGVLSATAAEASPGSYYKATPVAAAVDGRLIVRATPWRCGADGCVSNTKGDSRAAHMCESLVREIGAVSAFRAGGEEFGAEQLQKCNARAKTANIAAK